MRQFSVCFKNFSKKNLMLIFDYLRQNGFLPFDYVGDTLYFKKECTAEEWYEVYEVLVEQFNY